MALELSGETQPLPVFKVLYRNTNRIQERAGAKRRCLIRCSRPSSRKAVRAAKFARGRAEQKSGRREQTFATLAQPLADEAFNDLFLRLQEQYEVQSGPCCRIARGIYWIDRQGSGAHVAAAVRPLLCQSGIVAALAKLDEAGTCCRRCSKRTNCSAARR